MEQLGFLLVGLSITGASACLVRLLFISNGESHRTTLYGQRRLARLAPLSPCDPKAVSEYFRLYKANGDSGEFLSIPELISLLDTKGQGNAVQTVRFTEEGGYRLRL
jgi:hypothetical protein